MPKKYQNIIKEIDSSFNFVPPSEYVHRHPHKEKINHDIPFKEGVSGELNITLVAESPISLGGDQSDQIVSFFRIKGGDDGIPAIPGSSIRGMVRNVFEIATFSKLQQVDDKTFGLRDLGGRHVNDLYLKKLRGKQKAGYLQLIKGKPTIIPCDFLRLENRHIHDLVGDFPPNKTVKTKYEWWFSKASSSAKISGDVATYKGKNSSGIKYSYQYLNNAKLDDSGDYSAVFTGFVSNRKREFAFRELNLEHIDINTLDKRAWSGFLSVHGDDDKSNEGKKKPWNEYWKKQFNEGKKVPIFYLNENKRLKMGLAYMLKLPGDFTTHDMISNINSGHLDQDILDYTEAVFGTANDDIDFSLKSRVQFELATVNNADNLPKKAFTKKLILSEPKPSFFPCYIEQGKDKLDFKEQYKSYIKNGDAKPQIRGWKRYPIENKNDIQLLEQPETTVVSDKVSTTLEVVPVNTTFSSRIVFHNLLPQELGALIWSLKFEGGNHSIGTGKSSKFGQLKVRIPKKKKQVIVANDPESEKRWTLDELEQRFVDYMESIESIGNWKESIQIKTLLAMSNPELPNNFKAKLEHMELSDYLNAKKIGLVLSHYCEE